MRESWKIRVLVLDPIEAQLKIKEKHNNQK